MVLRRQLELRLSTSSRTRQRSCYYCTKFTIVCGTDTLSKCAYRLGGPSHCPLYMYIYAAMERPRLPCNLACLVIGYRLVTSSRICIATMLGAWVHVLRHMATPSPMQAIAVTIEIHRGKLCRAP